MERLTTRDLMTNHVIAVGRREDLASVHELMFEHGIRHLPVIDEERRVIGIISHRDVMGTVLSGSQYLPVTELMDLLRKMRVAEVMTSQVETIGPEESLAEAGRLMLESKFGCLPVTEGDRLIGIITEADFVRRMVEELEQAERAFEQPGPLRFAAH